MITRGARELNANMLSHSLASGGAEPSIKRSCIRLKTHQIPLRCRDKVLAIRSDTESSDPVCS